MGEVKVWATPVNSLVAFVKAELSAAQLEALLGQLHPGEAGLLSGTLMASATVPLDLVNAFTTLAAEMKGEAVGEFAFRAGRFGAEQGTRTIYKFILALMSPKSVLRAAPSMWRHVYDGGELVPQLVEGGGILTARDFPFDPSLCGRITGWFDYIGEKSAAACRTRHSSCRCRGDSVCAWAFDWRKP